MKNVYYTFFINPFFYMYSFTSNPMFGKHALATLFKYRYFSDFSFSHFSVRHLPHESHFFPASYLHGTGPL